MSEQEKTFENEVSKYDIAQESILAYKEKAQSLVILSVDDKEGFTAVSTLRKEIKDLRISVEKKRVELNTDALAWQRAVNAEAKRLTLELEPIEKDLEAKEKKVTEEKARIKREKENAERVFLQNRKDEVFNAGGSFDGRAYGMGFIVVFEDDLKTKSQEDWEVFIQTLTEAVNKKRAEEAETARLVKIAREKEEQDRKEALEKAKAQEVINENERKQKEEVQEVKKEVVVQSAPVITPIETTKPQVQEPAKKAPIGSGLFKAPSAEEMERNILLNFITRMETSAPPACLMEPYKSAMEHAKKGLLNLANELKGFLNDK